MSNERAEQIRKLVLSQLEGILKVAGNDISGTLLELKLQVAIEDFKSLGEDTNSSVKNSENFNSDNHPVVENQYDQWNDNYDNEYEDHDYDDNHEPVIPDGFADEEEYGEFLETQAAVLPQYENDFTGEMDTLIPDDVVGIVNINGEEVQVGNMEDSLNKVSEIMDEQNTIRDEETNEVLYHNEIENVPAIRVSFTRNDNQELTNYDVLDNIMVNRISQPMLEAFGDDYEVLNGESNNQKIVIFNINNNDNKQRRVAQGLTYGNGIMNFAGRHVFPGIGLITAKTIL